MPLRFSPFSRKLKSARTKGDLRHFVLTSYEKNGKKLNKIKKNFKKMHDEYLFFENKGKQPGCLIMEIKLNTKEAESLAAEILLHKKVYKKACNLSFLVLQSK